jgi:hypothetical protein
VAIVRPITQIMNREFKQAGGPGSLHNADVKRTREHRGEKREHVYLHAHTDRLQLTRRLVFYNFNGATEALPGASGQEQRADGVDGDALPADNAADIDRVEAQFIDGHAAAIDGSN